MSSFNSTTLDTKLRGLGAETFTVPAGETSRFPQTPSTGPPPADRPLRGPATISDKWQQAAMSYALTRIAEIATVEEVTAALERA